MVLQIKKIFLRKESANNKLEKVCRAKNIEIQHSDFDYHFINMYENIGYDKNTHYEI